MLACLTGIYFSWFFLYGPNSHQISISWLIVAYQSHECGGVIWGGADDDGDGVASLNVRHIDNFTL